MEIINLSVQNRTVTGKKNRQLRQSGVVPAVVYGQNKDNTNIGIDAKSLRRVYQQAGQSTILELDLEGQKENVLIHEVSTDPLNGELTHVDFYRINMNEAIRTEVPLHFVGESPAVYQDEGTLVKSREEVEVETLPAQLPPFIEVDISGLDDFEKSIHVSDIVAPEGVKILEDAEELVAKVDPPRSEEEMAALEEEIGEAVPEGVNEEAAGEEEASEEASEEAGEASAEGDTAASETESKDK